MFRVSLGNITSHIFSTTSLTFVYILVKSKMLPPVTCSSQNKLHKFFVSPLYDSIQGSTKHKNQQYNKCMKS